MTKRSHIVALAAVFALTGVSVIVAAQQRPNRVSDQQVTDVLSRMDTGIAAFRSSFDQAIDRNRINGSRAEGRHQPHCERFQAGDRSLARSSAESPSRRHRRRRCDETRIHDRRLHDEQRARGCR